MNFLLAFAIAQITEVFYSQTLFSIVPREQTTSLAWRCYSLGDKIASL